MPTEATPCKPKTRHNPTQPDKTRHPLKNTMSTHEKPDNTRQPCQHRPSLTLKLPATTALPHFVRRLVTNWGAASHQMAANGTNSGSHQQLVTSLVRNNGPLTRKIPFRTAPPPTLEFVPNMRLHQGSVTELVRNNGSLTRKITFRVTLSS